MSESNDRSVDPMQDPSATPVTEVGESDPNADSAEGLAGGMGVSSERLGTVRGGTEEVTYATAETHPEEPDEEGDVPPEQSAYDAQPEVHPDPVAHKHEFDPKANPGSI